MSKVSDTLKINVVRLVHHKDELKVRLWVNPFITKKLEANFKFDANKKPLNLTTLTLKISDT